MRTRAMNLVTGPFLATLFWAAPLYAQVDGISVGTAERKLGQVEKRVSSAKSWLSEVGDAYGSQIEIGQVLEDQQRLDEGRAHFALKDYERAAILLYPIVENERNKALPIYEDALYYLGESLRRSKNYGSARRYFEILLARASGQRLNDTILGLLEVAGESGRFADVDRYIARLRTVGTMSSPEVDYIHGKMMFRQAALDPAVLSKAYDSFKRVPSGHKISAQAAYYAGVVLVQMKDLKRAVFQFQEAIRLGAKEPAIQELGHLALGRIHQEKGDIEKSAASYEAIEPESEHFSEMLYELAWAYVRGANETKSETTKKDGYELGLEASELLMATEPDPRLYPEARLLQGNLQIRLGAPETAYDTFQAIIDRYGGARAKLQDLRKRSGTSKEFFDQLVAKDLEKVGTTVLLPEVVAAWALEKGDVERAVKIQRELEVSNEGLRSVRTMASSLMGALDGEQRYRMFPGLGSARLKALAVRNSLLGQFSVLLSIERRLVYPKLNRAERAAVDQERKRSEALEYEIAKLPMTPRAVSVAQRQIKDAYRAFGREAFRRTMEIASMRAQVVAVDAWLNEKYADIPERQRLMMRDRLVEAKNRVDSLDQELKVLLTDAERAEAVLGSDGGSREAQALRERYKEQAERERDVLSAYRGRLSSDEQQVLARLDKRRSEVQVLDGQLATTERAIEQRVAAKVQDVHNRITAELTEVEGLSVESKSLDAKKEELLGPIADSALDDVANDFDDLIRQADVGIIDVAWARKRSKSKKVSDLVREQQENTRDLDNEVGGVLEQ